MKNKKSLIIGIIIAVVVLAAVACVVVLLLSKKDTKITITFDADGGSEVSSVKITKGSSIELPETEKEGYNFEGWYNKSTKVSDKTKYKKDTTLKAKWIKEEAKTFVVTFDSNGGSKVEKMTVECDTELKLPKNPTREGYKFITWVDKNETPIYDKALLSCEDIKLTAKWEKEEEKPKEKDKKYTCPTGYTLDGKKCKIEGTVHETCPSNSTADGSLCIKTSDRNEGTRVCKEATVSIDGKGHTYTGGGDYYYIPNAYGKCAYYKWDSYTTQSECEGANDIHHKTTWVSQLNACYAETKMNNYETVCASDYKFYSSSELSSKFGVHDNGQCLKKVDKTKYCDEGYALTDGKCIKTIDATLE